jgi:hypothetical protein
MSACRRAVIEIVGSDPVERDHHGTARPSWGAGGKLCYSVRLVARRR